MTRYRISKHFVVEEFDCHDGTRVPNGALDALVTWADEWGEPLRAEFGAVRITSGYRTLTYNRSVGGAPQSFHRYDLRYTATGRRGTAVGVAADVVPARGTPAAWQAWARRRMGSPAWRLGAGRGAAVAYPRSGFIHLDTGPRRTWAG